MDRTRSFGGRLTTDRESAWERFLDEFAPLVLQVVRLFESDPDRVDDCFVFVCERLKQDDMRRLRSFDEGGPATFSTWLRAVVRNLCIDWRRHRFGRPRPFRVIGRLSPLDQKVYRALYLRGLTEEETLASVRHAFPALTRAALADSLERISRSLTSHQNWLLASRRLREVSLSGHQSSGETSRELDPPDAAPGPEEDTADREEREALRAALADLPSSDRLLIRLRYEQDLTLDEIARLTGIGSVATVHRAVQKALQGIKERLGVQEETTMSVKGE